MIQFDVTRPIEPGSVVLIDQTVFHRAEDATGGTVEERLGELLDLLVEKAGHDRFAMILYDGPTVPLQVLEPDQARDVIRPIVERLLDELGVETR